MKQAKPVRMIGVNQEITERKRIERERARLITILEETMDFVGTAAPNGQVIYLNRTARGILGLSPNEDMSLISIRDFHPEWAWRILEKEGIPQAIEHGAWYGETALLRNDGTEFFVSQIVMSHKSTNGQVEYLSTVARDVNRTQTDGAGAAG